MKITEQKAKELLLSKFWEKLTAREIVQFQIDAELTCMPFNVFHKALEESLGRGVYTHEIGLNWEGLKEELKGNRKAPTIKEVMELLIAESIPVVIVKTE